jgi:hypothetical protein
MSMGLLACGLGLVVEGGGEFINFWLRVAMELLA